MFGRLDLPAILDLKAAGPLKAEIQAHAGAALDLDASRVERLGGLCLQVLVTAEAAWRAADQPFRVVNAGEAFCRDARLMGAGRLVAASENGGGTC